MSIFDNRKVCAAVRTREDFEVALESKVEVIYLLYSNILTVKQHIDEGHAVNKKIFVHMDFAEGIGKDRAGLEYIKSLGVDGIVTTRTNLIRPAKEMGLFTIQRFFENNLNVSETSRKLFVHRNTLVYRLEKIKKLTGLDLREFDDAIVFKVALMVKKYLDANPVKY